MTFTNSTFLDAFGAGQYTGQHYNELAGGSTAPLAQLFTVGSSAPTITDLTGTPAGSQFAITVGLVLDRAHDPAALLSGNWAQREAGLSALDASGGPFATYGADPTAYSAATAAVTSALGSNAAQALASSTGYVSSQADRTIWVSLTPDQFETLFHTDLYSVTSNNAGSLTTVNAWTGSLTLSPSLAGVVGLQVEEFASIPNPLVLDSTLVAPMLGTQGAGNGATNTVTATPAAIAANYGFPLSAGLATDPVALIESDMNNQAGLFAAYNVYREQIGLPPITQAQFQILSGTNTPGTITSELGLDISVVGGAVPNSTQLLYSYLNGTPYNAYQQAYFDTVHHPSVLSSSHPEGDQPTANSPFMWAWQQLMIDGALANVTTLIAGGDQGSSAAIANGIANVGLAHASPFTLVVGGTSIATVYSALSDSTLSGMLALARQDDPGTLFGLASAGLKTLPSTLSSAAPGPAGQSPTLQALFETVWQELSVTAGKVHGVAVLESPYGANQTGSGGIATLTPIPDYQQAFGLSSLTDGSRGSPDVSALASGDSFYAALSPDYVNGTSDQVIHGVGGTSAAAPLWAALTTQFNAIFHDQHLPSLGYYNDLLYIADVIAPGSFNDIQLGNDINSFSTTATNTSGYYNSNLGQFMTPTGQGYSAVPGYDLASGLGTPDGLLLARALTAIAHQQVSFSTSPPLLDADGHGGWSSATDQDLILQATTPGTSAAIDFQHGGQSLNFASGQPGGYSFSAQLAEQVLQADFDPGLVTLFDRQAQGSVTSAQLHAGESLSVTIGGNAATAIQASLSNPFGFDDFFSNDGTLRVALPVAIAETVGAQNDQDAVVRIRQVGTDSLTLAVYRVDDYSGTIAGVHPGDPGYQAAVQARIYLNAGGTASIGGPGYGQFEQTELQHVNAGDLLAFQLTNNTHGTVFYGFADANEVLNGQPVQHLLNYGLNTWGFEDTYNGGDHDFNDLVFQLDFTSATGQKWLV